MRKLRLTETSSVKIIDVAAKGGRKWQIRGILFNFPIDCTTDGNTAELFQASRAFAVFSDSSLDFGVSSPLLEFLIQTGTYPFDAHGQVLLTQSIPENIENLERRVVMVTCVDVQSSGKIVAHRVLASGK